MTESEVVADPFGLQLARAYKQDVLDRPRVVGPPPREAEVPVGEKMITAKDSLKLLTTHWQACDALPEHCRTGRTQFKVASTFEEAQRLAEELLVDATKHYHMVGFEMFFNRASETKDLRNLVLVVGTMTGKAGAFRIELLGSKWPAALRNLFDSQFWLISEDVLHKYRYLLNTDGEPRRWLDTLVLSARLPCHPRWRWTSASCPSLMDITESVFGVYPGALTKREAEARIVTSSLGAWPYFKTPELLEKWGCGPLEDWRMAYFRNGVGKYFSAVVLYTLLECEMNRFGSTLEYYEAVEEVVHQLGCTSRSVGGLQASGSTRVNCSSERSKGRSGSNRSQSRRQDSRRRSRSPRSRSRRHREPNERLRRRSRSRTHSTSPLSPKYYCKHVKGPN